MSKYPARRRAVISTLRGVRRKAGLSQRAISVRLEESYNYANLVEHDQHGTLIEEFIAWCEVAEADPVEVMRTIMDHAPRARRRKKGKS